MPSVRKVNCEKPAMDKSICLSEAVEKAALRLQIDVAEGDWVAYKR
jgi:hypothetical protein